MNYFEKRTFLITIHLLPEKRNKIITSDGKYFK